MCAASLGVHIAITAQAPFRVMQRPGGAPLSVAMTYHGVNPLKDGDHALLGSERWNLTFRMAHARYAVPDRP